MNGAVNRRIGWLGGVASFALLAACHPANKAPEAAAVVRLPISTATDSLPAGGATVVLTTSSLTLKGEPDVEVAAVPSDTSHGFDPALKPGGATDLYVVSLGNALAARPSFDTLTVMADPSLSYRLFVEVLFTAQKAHGAALDDCFAVRAANGAPGELHAICLDRKSPPDGATPALRLAVMILPEGFAVRAAGAPLGTGCHGVGPGITVPRSSTDYDYAALTACMETVKGRLPASDRDESSVLLSANAETPLQVLVSTSDATRRTADGTTLFPDVTFAVNRGAGAPIGAALTPSPVAAPGRADR